MILYMSDETGMEYPLTHSFSVDLPANDAIPVGEFKSRNGEVLFTDDSDVECLSKAFSARTQDIPLKVEHGRDPVFGNRAVGWVTEMFRDGDFVRFRNEYTRPDYREMLLNREYRYTSPGVRVVRDQKGRLRPREIVEISLTNTPALPPMRELRGSTSLKETNSMTLLEKLIMEAFSLKEDATEAQLAEVAKKFSRLNEAQPQEQDHTSEFAAIKASLDDVIAKFEAFKSGDQAKGKTLVELALSERKITKAQEAAALKLAAVMPDVFAEFASNAAEVSPSKPVLDGRVPAPDLKEKLEESQALHGRVTEFMQKNPGTLYHEAVLAITNK